MAKLARALHRGEWCLLAILGGWSLVVLLAMLVRAHQSGLVFIGGDSRAPGDQLQYLAWIRDASAHGLISNLYELTPTPHVFLHPMYLLSGALVAAGVSPAVALLLWKPVAVLALFIGTSAFARRFLPAGWPRVLAIALGLFYFSPTQTLISQTGVLATSNHVETALRNDLLPALQLWGYLEAAIAIAAIPLAVLGAERMLDASRRAPGHGLLWYSGWTTLAGATASWLHPWQGETLLVILAAVAVLHRPRGENLPLLAPLVATLLPLLYYLILSEADASWGLAARQADTITGAELPVVALGLAPLAIPALLGARGPVDGPGELMLRLWPLAALVVYLGLRPPYPLHAFAGVAIPLAVLAVRWFRSVAPSLGRWRPWVAAAAMLALVGSCLPFLAQTVKRVDDGTLDLTLLAEGDNHALRWIAGAGPGGVLTTSELGYAVPGITGRRTWVGHRVWTPDSGLRTLRANALFAGTLDGSDTRALVRGAGARFILQPCATGGQLTSVLSGLGYVRHPFGCATVYERS